VPVRRPGAGVRRSVVSDLRGVCRVADVEESGALRVERLYEALAVDVEVVRGAVGGRRVAALLARDAPGAHGLEPERLVRCGLPATSGDVRLMKFVRCQREDETPLAEFLILPVFVPFHPWCLGIGQAEL
jgi:hypothetical protein